MVTIFELSLNYYVVSCCFNNFFNVGNLRQVQFFSNLGTNLSCVTVDSLTTCDDQIIADFLQSCCDDAGCVGTESAGVPGVSGFPRLSRVRVMPTVSKAASAQTTQTRTACRCSDVIDCLSD